MSRTGIADLPLHGGKTPKWLFSRMIKLSESILDVMVEEFSLKEVFTRFSNPFWFQSLTCILGYDWHSSGTTTVTCGALKEAIDFNRHGFAFVGGKGKTSRNTPYEIESISSSQNISSDVRDKLKYASKMTAKIDNVAIQDFHNLYHHSFLFTEKGLWCVIQQGMNTEAGYARRYHWCSEETQTFLFDPHTCIFGEQMGIPVLNMTSDLSTQSQNTCVDLCNDHPRHLQRDWKLLIKPNHQRTLDEWSLSRVNSYSINCLFMPRCINWRKMHEIYEWQPKNYEELISLRGVGVSTIRALALISELIYGDKLSWKDPVKYSFAHGGKDGVPFPVNIIDMDTSIQVIQQGIEEASVGKKEKLRALKRLKNIICINT